jgi:RNase H-like domain found in reverse transcriptase
LAIFDSEKPIILKIDVFDYAIGACIMQIGNDGKFHSLVFYFRKMISAEINYDIHDKELLVIVIVM